MVIDFGKSLEKEKLLSSVKGLSKASYMYFNR